MAKKRWSPPKTEKELQRRELKGLWRAIGLVKDIAEGKDKITLATILSIHKIIFEDAEPDIAGRFRVPGENVNKLKCVEPPLGVKVQEEVYKFWRDFDHKISLISKKPKHPETKRSYKKWFSQVLDLAVWTQHKFVSIHPFPQGNGRTCRLLTNLVLQRFGIKPSQVKYEGETREEYLNALCQADKYEDYEPLKKLIYRSILEVYEKEEKLRKRLATKAK